MTSVALLHLTWTLAALPALPSDTPPAPPVTVEQLATLRTPQEVVGVTLLADGSRAPAQLVLPDLENRRQTLSYMHAHYPEALRAANDRSLTIAWLFVNEEGRVGDVRLLSTSGYAELDSLSLAALRVAQFKPARDQGRAVAVWLPFPAGVPPYDELVAMLESAERDISEAPVEIAYTRKPTLINRNQVEAAIVRVIHQVDPQIREFNEALARAQMAGGTALVDIFINQEGYVQNALLKKSAGNRDLDGHAVQIARMMRFAPALNGEQPVAVWLEVPIRFVGNRR